MGRSPPGSRAVEPARQNMEQESPGELVCREGHGFLWIVVAIVPPLEFHLAVFDTDDPMIGNGDPVG